MLFVTLVKINPGKAGEFFQILKSHQSLLEGVKVHGAYITYGGYDEVVIWEAPDLSTANQILRRAGERGIASTETMLAQTPDEFFQ